LGLLNTIRRQTDATIAKKPRECVPALEDVVHRLGDIGMTREPAAFATHPSLEGGDQRRDPDLSDGMPLPGGQAVDVAFDRKDLIDPAHHLDGQRRPRFRRGQALGNIGEHEQLAPPMSPARRLKDRAGFACRMVEIIEPGICVGLQDAGVIREMVARMLGTAVTRVEEHRRRWRRPAERLIVTHIRPQATGTGLVLGQHRHRGVVTVDALGRQHMGADQDHQRRQRRGAGADPIGQRRDAEVDAFAREPLALPVQRLMFAELAVHDRCQQVWTGAATRDRMKRRRRLGDRLARPARELLAYRLDHLIATRDALQGLGDRLAELGELAAAARTGGW